MALVRVGERIRTGRIRRAIEGLTGTILIALGVRIATEA